MTSFQKKLLLLYHHLRTNLFLMDKKITSLAWRLSVKGLQMGTKSTWLVFDSTAQPDWHMKDGMTAPVASGIPAAGARHIKTRGAQGVQ